MTMEQAATRDIGTAAARPSRWYPVLLVGLPLWLAVSAAGALWYYFHLEKRAAGERQAAFAREISIGPLADDLRKFTSLIGERHTAGEGPSAGLGSAAAMIEGTLGPSNTGLVVRRVRGPSDWPLLETHIPARLPGAASVWVIAGYDSAPGSRGGQFNASGLAAVLAVIQAAANDVPEKHLRFLFLPHFHESGERVAPTLRTAAETIVGRGEADAVLWVEAMGAARMLLLGANRVESLPMEHLGDIGSVMPEAGLALADPEGLVPAWLADEAVRVATRGPLADGEADDAVPSPTITADAAGKLLELLRRMTAG